MDPILLVCASTCHDALKHSWLHHMDESTLAGTTAARGQGALMPMEIWRRHSHSLRMQHSKMHRQQHGQAAVHLRKPDLRKDNISIKLCRCSRISDHVLVKHV